MKLAILNAPVITSDGVYKLWTIPTDEAQAWAQRYKDNFDSAVGHRGTAVIMSTLLGVPIQVNRQVFRQQKKQLALVFKLKGRIEEGKILTLEEIEKIGYTFQLLQRVD